MSSRPSEDTPLEAEFAVAPAVAGSRLDEIYGFEVAVPFMFEPAIDEKVRDILSAANSDADVAGVRQGIIDRLSASRHYLAPSLTNVDPASPQIRAQLSALLLKNDGKSDRLKLSQDNPFYTTLTAARIDGVRYMMFLCNVVWIIVTLSLSNDGIENSTFLAFFTLLLMLISLYYGTTEEILAREEQNILLFQGIDLRYRDLLYEHKLKDVARKHPEFVDSVVQLKVYLRNLKKALDQLNVDFDNHRIKLETTISNLRAGLQHPSHSQAVIQASLERHELLLKQLIARHNARRISIEAEIQAATELFELRQAEKIATSPMNTFGINQNDQALVVVAMVFRAAAQSEASTYTEGSALAEAKAAKEVEKK